MSSSNIPVQNIYYLLAYAWKLYRPGDEAPTDQSECPDAHNLLALLFCRGIRRLPLQGIDRGYHGFEEETSRLRGRIEVLQSYRKLTHLAGKMVCQSDDLTEDTLPNQILKSTCQRLIRATSQLSTGNRQEVRHCLSLLNDISEVRITNRVFRQVQLHRNNRHYRLLMHVCQLLHELYLPEEREGKRRFRKILDEETIMHNVFERFVLEFARRHCQPAHVSAMQIKWQGKWDTEAAKVLPMMRTDVTIDRSIRKTILDCKYYQSALVSNHDRHSLHSAHLYQLTAYLRNKSYEEGWGDVEGILLYPAVNHHLELKFELIGHRIEIHSVDLDQPWPKIHERLLKVLS